MENLQKGRNCEIVIRIRKKLSDGTSIDLISFSKPKVELREIMDKDWVNDDRGAMGFEEMEEVKMVDRGRFKCDDSGRFGERLKNVQEGRKAGVIHGKMIRGIVREHIGYNARVERKFRNIDADEVRKHNINSFREDITRQGASKPVLHGDKSLIAQKALDGLRGRWHTLMRA